VIVPWVGVAPPFVDVDGIELVDNCEFTTRGGTLIANLIAIVDCDPLAPFAC
jgi:hypothetical protein